MRILILLFTAFISNAQHKANFKAAEKFSQANLSKMLKSTSVSPKWFEESDKFWREENDETLQPPTGDAAGEMRSVGDRKSVV